jgi:hypothetical protein
MSNNTTMAVRVASRKTESGQYFEGTVSIAGLKPTKLARRSDGSTQFSTRAAVTTAAKALAKSIGYSDVSVEDSSKPAKASESGASKVAAKKSSVAKTTVSVAATTTATTANKKTKQS